MTTFSRTKLIRYARIAAGSWLTLCAVAFVMFMCYHATISFGFIPMSIGLISFAAMFLLACTSSTK